MRSNIGTSLAKIIANEIINVQPITAPTAQIFTLKARYAEDVMPVVHHIGGNKFSIISCSSIPNSVEKTAEIFDFIHGVENTMIEDVVTFKSAKIAIEFKLRFC
jgi:hypothetical protein